MDGWAEIKKNWSSRKGAPKFAAGLIMLALAVYTALKNGLVQLYQTIFARLNAFLPLPGVAPAPPSP